MVGKIVVFSSEISELLSELTKILYEKGYFGFIEDSFTYVEKIYHYIDENIDKPITKEAPFSFKKFGNKYLKYKANSRTTWYIFFDQKENNFLVNHILNNHNEDFPELI